MEPEALTVRPEGNCPARTLQVYGGVPPVAASVALYATPTVPFGKLVVVMTTSAEAGKTLSAAVLVVVKLDTPLFVVEVPTDIWSVPGLAMSELRIAA